jgi:hypothetical protein
MPPPPPDTGGQATAATQPNSGGQAVAGTRARPPDTLVDPNLLAPPPPRVKPKPTSAVVVCQLCGTRIDVPLNKAGQEVKCPDCHTRNQVPVPKEDTKTKRPAGPTLEGAENYDMSEVVDRPKYRPLQATRGDYEVLSALDPATVEYRLSAPGQQSRAVKTVAEAPARDDDGEVTLSPPVERVEAVRDPRSILPQPELEPENALYDGRYDDGVIGDSVDPRSPDAWKRAPMLYGIVEFLFYPSTLLRWLGYAVGFALLANFGKFTIESAMNTDFIAPFLIPAFCFGCTVLLAPFSAALCAIVEDTGNGQVEVTEWPDWDIAAWMGKACYFPWAAFITSFPGILGVGVALLSGLDFLAYIVVATAPLLLSWMLLLPPAVYSQLAENSILSLISPVVIESYRIAGDAWAVFYFYSLLIVLLIVGAVALIITDNFLMVAVGGCAVVVVLFVYARLLGRLIWVAGQRGAASSPAQMARQVVSR